MWKKLTVVLAVGAFLGPIYAGNPNALKDPLTLDLHVRVTEELEAAGVSEAALRRDIEGVLRDRAIPVGGSRTVLALAASGFLVPETSGCEDSCFIYHVALTIDEPMVPSRVIKEYLKVTDYWQPSDIRPMHELVSGLLTLMDDHRFVTHSWCNHPPVFGIVPWREVPEMVQRIARDLVDEFVSDYYQARPK